MLADIISKELLILIIFIFQACDTLLYKLCSHRVVSHLIAQMCLKTKTFQSLIMLKLRVSNFSKYKKSIKNNLIKSNTIPTYKEFSSCKGEIKKKLCRLNVAVNVYKVGVVLNASVNYFLHHLKLIIHCSSSKNSSSISRDYWRYGHR